MANIKIENFSGFVPKLSPKLLPEHVGQWAQNCDVRNGKLRALNGFSEFIEIGVSAMKTACLFRGYSGVSRSARYLWWPYEVDYIESLRWQNASRLIYTGDETNGKKWPKQTIIAAIPANGTPDFPATDITATSFELTAQTVQYRRLGVKAPREPLKWELANILIQWESGRTYKKNDLVVSEVADGIVYKCIKSHYSGSILHTNTDYWLAWYVGVWTGSTTYAFESVVYNNSSFFICIADHTSSAAGEAGDEPSIGADWETKWQIYEVPYKSVAYAYTYVTDYGAESDLSPPTDLIEVAGYQYVQLSNFKNPMELSEDIQNAGDYIQYFRIYKTVAGSESAEWQLAQVWYPTTDAADASFEQGWEVPVVQSGFYFGETATHANKLGDINLDGWTIESSISEAGEAAVTQGWLIPPEKHYTSEGRLLEVEYDAVTGFPKEFNATNYVTTGNEWHHAVYLSGITQYTESIVCGFIENEVWFSVPNFPYAWPAGYMIACEYDIVALAVYDQNLVVLTKGNPYLISGVDPEALTRIMFPFTQPCVSKGSVKSSKYGVIYACPDGLFMINNSGGSLITDSYISREQWTRYISTFHDEDEWTTATSYTIGDLVYTEISGSDYIFECITTHTSGATTQPISGASWQSNWTSLPYINKRYGKYIDLVSIIHNDVYYCFQKDTGYGFSFQLNSQSPTLMFIDLNANASYDFSVIHGFTDVETDYSYFLSYYTGTSRYYLGVWDQEGNNPMTYTWRSKLFSYPFPISFSVARVISPFYSASEYSAENDYYMQDIVYKSTSYYLCISPCVAGDDEPGTTGGESFWLLLGNPGATIWSADTTYSIDDQVTKTELFYKCIKEPCLNQDPDTETTYWVEIHPGNVFFKAYVDGVLLKTKIVKNENVFRLPATKGREWYFEVEASAGIGIDKIEVATTTKELVNAS